MLITTTIGTVQIVSGSIILGVFAICLICSFAPTIKKHEANQPEQNDEEKGK